MQAEIDRVLAEGAAPRPRARGVRRSRRRRCGARPSRASATASASAGPTSRSEDLRGPAARPARPGTADRAAPATSTPTALLARAQSRTSAARTEAERAELTMAAQSVGKVWMLRHEIQGVALPADFAERHPEVATARHRGPRRLRGVVPEAVQDPQQQGRPGPEPAPTGAARRRCRPSAGARRSKRKNQSYWARRLGTTTAGTAITDMVRVVNNKTDYDEDDARRALRRARHQRLQLQAVVPADDAPRPRLPGARRPPPGRCSSSTTPTSTTTRAATSRSAAAIDQDPGRQPQIGYFEPWDQSKFDPSEPAHRPRAVAQRLPARSAPTSPTSSTTSASDVRGRTTIALALLLALTGCAGTDEPDGPTRATTRATTQPDTEPHEPAPTSPPTCRAAARSTTRSTPSPPPRRSTGRTPASRPAPRYVKGPEWEALADADDARVDLRPTGMAPTSAAGRGRTISEVLMSERVGRRRPAGQGRDRPQRGRRSSTSPPARPARSPRPAPASGGSWALTDGDLYYPTYGDERRLLPGHRALADGNGEDGWCAPDRTGFSGLTASEHGVGMMTFDDARPVACRTANLLDDSGVPQPVEGPEDCTAWDVAATADGAVWSEVPRPRRQEEAHFHASADGTYFDLGPGTTGTAVPCGDSVFFVRDPQGRRRAGPTDALDARSTRSRSPTSPRRPATPSSASRPAAAACSRWRRSASRATSTSGLTSS